MNKYHAKRTYSELSKRWFASKAECRRGEELRLLEMGGEIANLQYQVKFVLSEKPKVTIAIDFAYLKDIRAIGQRLYDGTLVYEDTKGVLTRDFRTKLAWLKQQQGIEVLLTK